MNTYSCLRRARRAAGELRRSPHGFSFAEAVFADRATRDLFDALIGLGILERTDLDRVPERGPLIAAA